jgi:hypothetical protein
VPAVFATTRRQSSAVCRRAKYGRGSVNRDRITQRREICLCDHRQPPVPPSARRDWPLEYCPQKATDDRNGRWSQPRRLSAGAMWFLMSRKGAKTQRFKDHWRCAKCHVESRVHDLSGDLIFSHGFLCALASLRETLIRDRWPYAPVSRLSGQ